MPAAMNEENLDVKPINELSELDKACVAINYPFETSSPSGEGWTIAHALNVAGVDSLGKRSILESHRSGDWVGLRKQFGVWCAFEQGGPVTLI